MGKPVGWRIGFAGSIPLGGDRIKDLGACHQDSQKARPKHNPSDPSGILMDIFLAPFGCAQSQCVDNKQRFETGADNEWSFDQAQHECVSAIAGPTPDLRHSR